MGDPKKLKKKYNNPRHPWEKTRIDEEKKVLKDYGLKRKNEIWKVSSQLRRYFDQAKSFIGSTRITSDVEKSNFIKKLQSLGLLDEKAQLEDVLNLSLKDLMERRLQTILVRKNMASSMTQARQFIVHEHIAVGDKKITTPSYMVSVTEEGAISYALDSPYVDVNHQQVQSIKGVEEEKKKIKAKEEESADKDEIKETSTDGKTEKKTEDKPPKEEKKEAQETSSKVEKEGEEPSPEKAEKKAEKGVEK